MNTYINGIGNVHFTIVNGQQLAILDQRDFHKASLYSDYKRVGDEFYIIDNIEDVLCCYRDLLPDEKYMKCHVQSAKLSKITGETNHGTHLHCFEYKNGELILSY